MQKKKFTQFEFKLMRPILRFFNFISRHTSYTFAVAFLTGVGGVFIASYIAIFLSVTLTFKSVESQSQFISLFYILILGFYLPGYFFHFGILSRWKIPALNKYLRLVNKHIQNNKVKQTFKDSQSAINLLKAVEKFPVINVKAAAFYPSVVMLVIVIREFFVGEKLNAGLLFIGITAAIIVYIFFTYIVAELLTGPVRRRLKRYMVLRKIDFKEKYIFSIRQKFLFISFLVTISMVELSIMFYYSTDKNLSVFIILLFVFMAVFIVSAILFFYLVSIEESLYEIQAASINLAKGGKGKLYLSSMDKELVKMGNSLISAAFEVNDIRNNLKQKVKERTEELNKAMYELTKKDNIIQYELDMASDIQKGIMPKTPYMENCIKVVSYYNAMEKVGGDFFDIIPLKGGSIGIVLADVSGHGIPAAFITAMAKISFETAAREYLNPQDFFHYVNKEILRTVKTGDYLTAFMFVISPSFDIYYSNAGHRRAIIQRYESKKIEELDTKGMFLGAFHESQYTQKKDILEFGDRIFIYTDGLGEALNSEGEEYSEIRIIKILKETQDKPLEQVKEILLKDWKNFTKGVSIQDDVTFLIIELDKECKTLYKNKMLGLKYCNQGDIDNAIFYFQKALEFEKNDNSSHFYIARCFQKKQDHKKVIFHLEKYLEKKPEDFKANMFIATAYFNIHKYKKALSFIEKALQIEPNQINCLTIKANILKKLNKPKEALKVFNYILNIDPSNKKVQEEIKKIS